MSRELINDSTRYSSSVIIGMCFYCVSFIGSIVLVGTQQTIGVRRPWILLLVSLTGLIPAKDKSFTELRKLLIIYFICMLLSQLALKKIVLGSPTYRMILPKSLIPILLYAIAYALFISKEDIFESIKRNKLWYWLWGTVGMIIIGHMICLFIPLKTIYGYGYMHNVSTLKNVVLYTMCFVFTWDILNNPLVRLLSFSILILYFFTLAIS